MITTPSRIPQGASDDAQQPLAHGNLRSSALPLVALVVLGLGALSWVGEGPAGGVLHARPSGQADFDSDGLSNAAEQALGTYEYATDSDADGFGDLEEFARGSDPSANLSTPLPTDLALNMSISGEGDGLRLQIATFFTDDTLENKQFQVGVVVNGEVRFLPWVLHQPGVQLLRKTAANGVDDVLLMTVPFPEQVVHALGEISIFSVLSVDGQPFIAAAAGIDLVSHDGVVLMIQQGFDERVARASAQSLGSSNNLNQGPTSGAIYRPIPTGAGGLPNTWNPGEICYQATIEVANDNGIVSHEVIAADCISGWDAHCRSDCSSSVGEVFQTFDPLGLVGG